MRDLADEASKGWNERNRKYLNESQRIRTGFQASLTDEKVRLAFAKNMDSTLRRIQSTMYLAR